jgi:non-specific serine/threonine protein kinase/serine/threonine-protein kinase
MYSGSKTTSAELESIEEVFHAALDRDPAEVGAFLDDSCAGNDLRRREVERLLASHRAAGDFIAAPLAAVDTSLFDEELPDRLLGRTIGHYEIERRIGSGGMGVVYLARRADRQYEKLVAIKLIKRGMDSEAVLRHFRNERQILASLDHPNIARLLDGDTTEDGLPYFVMEYVEGVPIDEFCEREALSVAERLQLFRQVCGAVSYAHRRAVIHRDIKPSNILVSADGVPKLLDFGIAKLLAPGSGAEPAATMIGVQVMTPEYASPEQVLGSPATTVSDVYSLGVVLYRLLVGRVPYRLRNRPPSATPEDRERTLREMEPQRPSAVAEVKADAASVAGDGFRAASEPSRGSARRVDRLRRELRGDLDNIVLMALRKEPERRYQSVEQLSDDIRRHLDMLPVLARPDTFAYRCSKFMRRNVAATVAASLLVLTLLGGIVATSWQAQKAREQETIAKAEKARAERRFNEVRQLAHAVLFDYHDAIKDLAGATTVRERLVRDGLAYLDSLAGEATGDPALQRELAEAYERLGDVRGAAYAASLGDVAGARESYLKALEIRKALVVAAPDDVQGRRDLAKSYVRVGSQMLDTAESARGTDYLRAGVAIYRGLAAEHPADAQSREDLAAAYNDLGLALEDRGDISESLKTQREALALREALAASNPADQTQRRNLSVSYINVGRALVLSGDIQGALSSTANALAIHTDLLAADPHNAAYRRTLAIAYQNDGDYRSLLGDTSGALRSFQRKLALDEQSVADDPANAQARGDLGYTCERVGDLLAQSGQYMQALSFKRRAVDLYEKQSAEQPQHLTSRFRAIISRASLGGLQAKLGERRAALDSVSIALANLNGVADDPTNGSQRGLRAQVYEALAAVHVALAGSATATAHEQREQWRAARAMYVSSLEIWEDMQSRGLKTALDEGSPAQVKAEIARCDANLRKL